MGVDGWFETADRADIERVVFSDSIKYLLKVLGREGETVKVLGELVDLVRVRAAIEATAVDDQGDAAVGYDTKALLSHRTWVVAVPDARREHELVLVVERRGGTTTVTGTPGGQEEEAARALLGRLSALLAPFEIPSRVVVLDEIPRSSLGKVLTSLLTERVAKP